MSAHKTIAIIGGGAAGFFSAICAAQLAKQRDLSLDIRILESTKQYLTKVKISGGGRCNVTHDCFDVELFCQNYPRGSRELLSPMQKFQARDTVEWFKQAGVHLVAEADGRMFPDTNTSATIVDCYLQLARELKVKLVPDSPVTAIESPAPHQLKLHLRGKESFTADAVLVATGSAPSGYRLAESLGHTITELAPSLFSFKIKDPLLSGLQGLSFSDATLKLTLPGKKAFKQRGPVLITHWGLSGPAVLKLSAWAAREMKQANYDGTLTVNWMGTEKPDEVEKRLKLLKEKNLKSYLKNSYPQNLPKRFWLNLLEKLSIDQEKQWSRISNRDIAKMSHALTASSLHIAGQNRYKDEFVECGGVALPEVDFKTMQSKVCPRLYFAGEILDVDGITGGFNFQHAWTTAWIAAQHMVI